MEKLARMLLNHLGGILNYCKIKVPMGVVEAVNGNIKALLRRGRGYRDLDYLLLKAQRLAATKTEFVTFQKAAYNAHFYRLLCRAIFSITCKPSSRSLGRLTCVIHVARLWWVG